jgi:hypothetical protein
VSDKVKEAVKSIQAEIDRNVKGLSHDEYEEFLDELECETETRREALKDDRRRDEAGMGNWREP